jgi:hypothetical protein
MHFDIKGIRMLNLFSLRFPIFMRKLSIIIVLIGCFSTAHCQTFKGTVYDRSTDSTLSSAIVYISGTSVGTYSDINGNFELDVSKCSFMPITISMPGYYSVTLSGHGSNKMYDIYLYPKIKESNGVIVKGEKGKWEEYLRIFKREFLGETYNASDCDILNENDLYFSYNSDSSTLRVFTLKPILIHNKALGYDITCYLDHFRYTHKYDKSGNPSETFGMMGNYLFKDDLSILSESEKSKVEEIRRSAYQGSCMQFLRLLYEGNLNQRGKFSISLLDNSLFSTGFIIGSKTRINSNSLVIRKDSITSYFKKEGKLQIRFGTRYSTIELRMDSVCFEKNGYFDPNEIWVSGDMSKRRISDQLPFEYSLKQ